jgi:superfamily II DNA or RNA helicase
MQRRGAQGVVDAIESGKRRIVLASPTGTGKSAVMMALIERESENHRSSVLYTHRRLLLSQVGRDLDSHEIEYGIRAAGHKPALLRPVQLAMSQSEASAVYKQHRRELHAANLVLSDELHAQGGDTLPRIHADHYAQGAAICGVTATPIDLAGEWDILVVAGTNSEGRECGALVPAYHFCPDEPDLKHIRNYRVGEDLTDKENSKAMMRPGVFGRVLKHYNELNPTRLPTLLFAPDVAGSIFFAEQFEKAGISAAHIDAKQIYFRNEFMESDDDAREKILKMTETGEVQVLTNRFVCLDSETEILTQSGWVGVGNTTAQHRVANWEDGHIYFCEPLEVLRRQRAPSEGMVSLETPRRSIRVTADHELLYRTGRSGAFRKAAAHRLVNEKLELPVSGVADPLPAEPPQEDMLANLPRRITANSFLLRSKGWPADDSRAEAERRLRARAEILRRKKPRELTVEECEFIGIWIGDGNKNHLQSGGIEYRLWQPAKYKNIVRRIDELIALLGYDSVRREGEKTNNLGTFNSVQWSFGRGTGFGSMARNGLFAIEPYLEKSGSEFLWGLNDQQFSAVIHGLWLANGMQHKDDINPPDSRLMIYSANRRLFDLLQAIATCRGWRASIRTYPQTKKPTQFMHLLTMSRSESHACTKYCLQMEATWKPEDVWCVRTPSGNIITRRHGSVTVMGNCREGINMPHIGHCIFACVFGSLKTYLQAGGRALRAHPSMDRVTIQDHGGSYLRHGSLNADRDWVLGMKGYVETGLRQEAMREKPDSEPIRCVACGMMRLSGPKCPFCGHVCHKRSRAVIQIDGSLKMVDGPAYKPHRVAVKADTQKLWERYYYGAKRKGRTFKQAMAWMFYNEHYWPPNNLPLMPIDPQDWFEKVSSVPKERLR